VIPPAELYCYAEGRAVFSWNFPQLALLLTQQKRMEVYMGFGRGALLWLIGIPLPIILLLALFMHH
jgi:hypothetical protein